MHFFLFISIGGTIFFMISILVCIIGAHKPNKNSDLGVSCQFLTPDVPRQPFLDLLYFCSLVPVQKQTMSRNIGKKCVVSEKVKTNVTKQKNTCKSAPSKSKTICKPTQPGAKQ